MQTSISPVISQKQELQLNPTLMLYLSVLQMPAGDLIHKLKSESISNRAMIIKWPQKNLNTSEYLHSSNTNYSCTYDDIIQDATQQIKALKLPVQQKKFLLSVLLHQINENLYLDKTQFLKKYSASKYVDWLKPLKKIHPIGLGAFNLQERFKMQLEFAGLQHSLAYKIIHECWSGVIKKKINKISFLLNEDDASIKKAFSLIKAHCFPRLVNENNYLNESMGSHLTPDLILNKDGSLCLNEDVLPTVQVSKTFVNRAEYAYAKHLVHAIEYRHKTLLTIAKTVFNLNAYYFSKGPYKVKKITLRMLAEHVPFSQSTLSRALKHKTILTPYGIKTIGTFLKPLTSS